MGPFEKQVERNFAKVTEARRVPVRPGELQVGDPVTFRLDLHGPNQFMSGNVIALKEPVTNFGRTMQDVQVRDPRNTTSWVTVWSDADGEVYRENLSEQEAPSCPACNGPGVYMGTLGNLDHFRCRNCGMDFSRPADERNESLNEAGGEPSAGDQSRGVRLPPGYSLTFGGFQSRFEGDKLAYDWYVLSDRKGEIARISDNGYGRGRFHASLDQFRRRYGSRIGTNEIRMGLGSDLTPRGDGSLQSAVDAAVASVNRVKDKLGESQATPFNESKDSTGKALKVGDTVVYSGTFLRNIGMYAGDMTQDAGSVTDVKPLSGDRALVTVDFDIAGEMKVLSVNLTRKDRVQYEPR